MAVARPLPPLKMDLGCVCDRGSYLAIIYPQGTDFDVLFLKAKSELYSSDKQNSLLFYFSNPLDGSLVLVHETSGDSPLLPKFWGTTAIEVDLEDGSGATYRGLSYLFQVDTSGELGLLSREEAEKLVSKDDLFVIYLNGSVVYRQPR
ncbi:hypothetical protein phiLo_60 [Thermus phage phiLo]|nr:hypothetical protein phiLo_60 [Thermus phage phiLo]